MRVVYHQPLLKLDQIRTSHGLLSVKVCVASVWICLDHSNTSNSICSTYDDLVTLSAAMVSSNASNHRLGFLMKEMKLVMVVRVCYRLMKERK